MRLLVRPTPSWGGVICVRPVWSAAFRKTPFGPRSRRLRAVREEASDRRSLKLAAGCATCLVGAGASHTIRLRTA
jgi:hypothetical protein